MSKGDNRRCYFFDANGEPKHGGCPRRASICAFYHPEEKGWDTARITKRRGSRRGRSRSRSRTPPPSSFNHRRSDSGYQRRPSHSPRSSSRSRGARQDSIATDVQDPYPRTSLTDVSSSSAIPGPSSPKIQKQQQQPQASSSSSTSLPTPPTTAPHTSFGQAPFNRITTTTMSSSTIPSLPRAMRSPPPRSAPRWPSLRTSDLDRPGPPPPPPPAPPKDPSPMPPPPPLPAVPLALSAGVAPSTTAEPSVEDKRAMWEERTRILSESELIREQLTVLEEQYDSALKITQSRYFANLPEEDRIRLKDQLSELEKQRDETKKIHDESVEKLFKTGSWPVAPPNPIEDGVEEQHKEVVKYIQELKDTALEISKILGDISMIKPPPAPLFLTGDYEDDDDEGGAAAMDVDQPDGVHHKSRKRRRIADGQSGSGIPTQELNEFLERLAHMEGLISTLENDITEHGRETREEFEQLVDVKLDEFQNAREEEERRKSEDERQQMQDLEQEITITGEQVGELAGEIGDLIMRVGRLEVEVGVSRKGRQESFEKVLEVEQRLQEYISTRESNIQKIQTFEKALNAYTSRPPSPPATPLNSLPPFDYIFQHLEEPIIQTLRSHLVPVIEELRKDIEDMVKTQNEELYSTLRKKITVTLHALDVIQSKINSGDIVGPAEQSVG